MRLAGYDARATLLSSMPMNAAKNFGLCALLALSLVAEQARGQTSSPSMAMKFNAANFRAVPAKEALIEIYHTSGKSGEILLNGRAHKRAPAEQMQVELAFRSEAGVIAIPLPIKRLSPDTARIASFGFETIVQGLPQIAPSDPRHAQPFFAIHLAERNGARYYREESYAQFISSAEKPLPVQPVIELPTQALWASVRKPASRAARNGMTTPSFSLKATRPSKEVCVLEWDALPHAVSSAQTLALVFRNEQHVAIAFARRYVENASNLSANTKYRVEQIGKDGTSASSNTIALPLENAREAPLDTGVLYAASNYVERTPEALAAVVSKHNAAIQYCYQREQKLNSALKGELRVRIVISARGSVDSVKVLSSSLQSRAVEDCVMGRIKRWNDFGQSDPGRGDVAIKQTYVFGY